jgi:hypothetical protein
MNEHPEVGDAIVFRGAPRRILGFAPNKSGGTRVRFEGGTCALDALEPYGDAAGSWCLPGVEDEKVLRDGGISLEPAVFEVNKQWYAEHEGEEWKNDGGAHG